ncbi:MAG: thioesterase-like protein [Actinomycetia bacterium]|nr:thioesterase-like protein [Actinomycetes bacterium]MCP4223974.1 thioesterase-like protein [Actinomycetes bacterium]MCP5031254.1 thioesterase-like protein [Actinomycetes bacterium]
MAQDIPAPFVGLKTEIKPEWIDQNGHFNAGYYFVVFDDAVADWTHFIGLDDDHRAANKVTTFSVEGHITFERELQEGDPIEIRTQLLGWDAKRVHCIHFMYHRDEGWLAATNELMSMHISEETRRSAPMAPEVQERLAAIEAAHSQLPTPPQVGRVIGLRSGRP